MTTVVVVKKNKQIVIAAESLVTFGDTRLNHRFEANTKIFKFETATGPTYIGMAGTVAHFPALRALRARAYLPIFLQTKEDDNDPYESSQFSVVIANQTGIYGLYSYREVFEFKEFWGIGSGRGFALGAMHATYHKAKTAREIAQAGIQAGCEFDKNSGGAMDLYSIKMK